MAADNLFLNLHRWAHRQDENFKTDSLAADLRAAAPKESPGRCLTLGTLHPD